jgi:hypothetical protein
VNFILTDSYWLRDFVYDLLNWAANETVVHEDQPVSSRTNRGQPITE